MPESINFETEPSQYRHWHLQVDGDRARLNLNVQEAEGLRDTYVLKMNSYDLGVDVELADALQRLRFENPQVKVVVLGGTMDRIFCAGANIQMLRTSTHAFKVNFCKFTNETRLYIEDASANSNMKFLCALHGTASGGGYELAMAADKILLVDDRSSAVSFPETPLLGVLPGTGGLTRLVDKRKVRRDRADIFSTIAEGVKGKRAVEWNLVDGLAPLSTFDQLVTEFADNMASEVIDKSDRNGISLKPVTPKISGDNLEYEYVNVEIVANGRVAALTLNLPANASQPATGDAARDLGSDWWVLKMFREFDDALLRLRVNRDLVGLITVKTRGSVADALAMDATLESLKDHWFVNEVRHQIKRVLKRLDLTAKSIFAIADEGSCFAGTFLEILLAADRSYVLNDPDFPVTMGVSVLNGGAYLMSNGITRLETRFLGTPDQVGVVLDSAGSFDAETADELGLATSAPDEIDWEDELRVAIEERTCFSPDALTGMEANLRFAGPETMETKIFGRLSAWQNWIFQRPNAVGERGALTCYGTPNRPEFNYQRT
ncbi:MAG: benzoyl-CoA-dihydrodiol lyase [Planctomycetota bacterium]|jgi:benzoyl-CoA-dihydrodiol lyase